MPPSKGELTIGQGRFGERIIKHPDMAGPPIAGIVVAGLAPWQQRRATDMMQARLGGPLTIKEIARACQITPSHFARAFRGTFGRAPYRYLTDLRITEAKRQMMETDLPLTTIAMMCGFTDQSHFTRVFRRLVGTSPGLWRQSPRK